LAASGGVTTADNSTLLALVCVATILIWVFAVLFILRHRRQKQKEQRAKILVSAASGDLMFGPGGGSPGSDGTTGGEIDPTTGEIRLYRTGEGGDADMAGMPSVFTGLRQNPMFGDLGEPRPSSGYLDGPELGMGDGDSLGDLSDFDDADFEAFADSLLDGAFICAIPLFLLPTCFAALPSPMLQL
jgi:hypothetical protein